MSTKQLAEMYVRGRIRGDRDSFAEAGRGTNTVHAGHHGGLLRMHSAAPPPPAEYDAWLQAQATEKTKYGHTVVSGAKLRRAVVMRRNGCALAEIGRSLGVSGKTACLWLGSLPEELRA
jgi:hypothetical protein